MCKPGMYKYVLRRLLLTIPVLFGVIFIVFSIMALTPGDPGRLILGNTAKQEAVDQLNHELGFDQPFFIRFFNYCKDIVTKFDFGKSYRTQKPVYDEIFSRFPHTLKLAISSIVFSSLLGVTLGVLSAVKQYSLFDTVSTVLAMFFAAIPAFWFGMMMIMLFALRLGWLPSSGIDSWKSFIMPTITLTVGTAAGLLRLTRSTTLETIRQDYVRTARAKGASERTVIFKHVLKNALMPVITMLGMSFGGLLGGAVICESVFAMPGLGQLILNAIRMKDIPTVMASTLFLAALFCLIMLVVDLIQAFIDPRIKAKYAK